MTSADFIAASACALDLGRERRLISGEAGFTRREPAARVEDLEASPLPLGRELLAVARHARLLFDDRVAAPDDAVDERRLPDVRPADDRDDGSFGGHERSAATREAPSVGTISTGCGQVLDGRAVEEATARQRDIGQQVARAGRGVGEHRGSGRRR